MISTKISCIKKGFKYFIGYNYDNKVKPFCIKLPKMSLYARYFDETKHMKFLIKNKKLLEVYTEK